MSLFERILKGGDEGQEALSQLVIEYREYMIRICSTVLKNRTQAEDLFPRIIMELPSCLERLENIHCKPKTYLYKLCQYYSLNARRTLKSYENNLDNLHKVHKTHSNPESMPSDLGIVNARINDVLIKWPSEYSRIFYMRVDGYSYEEISKELNINERTCRRRFFDIKRSLQNDDKIKELYFDL